MLKSFYILCFSYVIPLRIIKIQKKIQKWSLVLLKNVQLFTAKLSLFRKIGVRTFLQKLQIIKLLIT